MRSKQTERLNQLGTVQMVVTRGTREYLEVYWDSGECTYCLPRSIWKESAQQNKVVIATTVPRTAQTNNFSGMRTFATLLPPTIPVTPLVE